MKYEFRQVLTPTPIDEVIDRSSIQEYMRSKFALSILKKFLSILKSGFLGKVYILNNRSGLNFEEGNAELLIWIRV